MICHSMFINVLFVQKRAILFMDLGLGRRMTPFERSIIVDVSWDAKCLDFRS